MKQELDSLEMIVRFQTGQAWCPGPDWEVCVCCGRGLMVAKECVGDDDDEKKRERFQFELPSDWLLGLTKRIDRLRIPVGAKSLVGCDGGHTDLWLKSDGNSSHYRWWGSGPREWSRLTSLAEMVISEFESLREE